MNSKAALDLDRIRSLLGDDPGRNLQYFPDVGSTNEVASRLLAGKWESGTAIFADHQTAGRGRRGRSWSAPVGSSLFVSVILRPTGREFLTDYVLLASLAVSDAITQSTALRTSIKWPNDVHVEGRKVAGVLAEVSGEVDSRAVILGIGINVNVPDRYFRDAGLDASSLAIETRSCVDRERVAAALLDTLDLWYRVVTRSPEKVFHIWKSRLVTVGAMVDVIEASGSWTGRAVGVERDGGLIVRQLDGKRRVVHAADVSIRPRCSVSTPKRAVQ